jgi:hypothetical protein
LWPTDILNTVSELATEVRRLRAELDDARPVIDAALWTVDEHSEQGTADWKPLTGAVRAYRETRP